MSTIFTPDGIKGLSDTTLSDLKPWADIIVDETKKRDEKKLIDAKLEAFLQCDKECASQFGYHWGEKGLAVWVNNPTYSTVDKMVSAMKISAEYRKNQSRKIELQNLVREKRDGQDGCNTIREKRLQLQREARSLQPLEDIALDSYGKLLNTIRTEFPYDFNQIVFGPTY